MLSTLIGLKLAFLNLTGRKRATPRPAESSDEKEPRKGLLKRLYDSNLLFNDCLGIFIILACFAVISILPFGDRFRWSVAPFIACFIPFLLGFYRSTGVGIQCGVIGMTAGLFWMAAASPGDSTPLWSTNLSFLPPGLSNCPYFLLLTLVSNISGFLGGFAGLGQVKDSKVAIIFDIQIQEKGQALNDLIDKANQTITDFLEGRGEGKPDLKKWLPDLSAAQLIPTQNTDQNVILNYQQHIRWRLNYRPQAQARQWLLKRRPEDKTADFDMNKLLDYVSNVLRHRTFDLVIQNNPKIEDRCAGNFLMALQIYMETPSIIWVDDKTLNEAQILFKYVLNSFKDNESYPWHILNTNVFNLRYWRDHITLEQTVKQTFGAEKSAKYVINSQLIDKNSCLVNRIDDFSGVPTFFDRWRGRTLFLGFLIGPLILGLLDNWLSEFMF
jgi:hypothetical protein